MSKRRLLGATAWAAPYCCVSESLPHTSGPVPGPSPCNPFTSCGLRGCQEGGWEGGRGWYEDHLAHGHFLQKSWGAVGGVGVKNQFHFPLLQGGRTPSCPVLLNRPRGRGLGEHTGHSGGLDAGASRKWYYQPDSTFLPMPLDKRRSAQGEHACERETKPKTGFWQKWQRENDNHG